MKIILPLLLFYFAFCNSVRSQPIYNLDFEDINSSTGLPNGWGLGNVKNSNIPNDKSINGYRTDSVVKQHGRYSLLIDWTGDYGEKWTASNFVIPTTFYGKKITLTGYLKTEQVIEGAGLWMRIDGSDNMLAFDNMQNRSVKGTTDWKEYTVTLDYNQEQAKKITFGCLIIGKGKVWTDNLQIKIDGKDISEAVSYSPILSKPDQDSMYNNGSGITEVTTINDRIKILTNLGMLWGFIKYYHANVNNGSYNMDAELFRVLPQILAAGSISNANAVMDKWVDIFGKPDSCKTCTEFKKTEDTKLSPDYGYLFDRNNLPQTLIDKLNYIKRNRSKLEKHYYIEMAPGVGNPKFTNEKSYSKIPYPDAGIRLLALYRYWNMVQYFFPDRHLIGEDWNKVLTEFIPEFCSAGDTLSYQLACLRLIARINDTHANVWGGGTEIQKFKGMFITPFKADFIENKLVVTGWYKDTMNVKELIQPGDIIEKINDTAVGTLITKYLPLTPASNYETQLRDLPGLRGFLLRSNNKHMQITVNRNGTTSDINIERVLIDQNIAQAQMGKTPDVAYKMLNGNIGYIFPGKLNDKDIDGIKNEFENTTGIIIDMRCYPSAFMPFTYGSWLKPAPSVFAKFTGGSVDFPGSFDSNDGPENGVKKGKTYKGKLVIIVNAVTQSQAEYTTMALSNVPGAQVIGSTTAGADGNVSEIILPGGIRTMFSGIGVLYPDGTESQRKGVKIDKVVKPTINGIREGRDELLHEAIKLISN